MAEKSLYSHRYKVIQNISAEKFTAIATDFRNIIKPLSHLGVAIAGSKGDGKPEINPEKIKFNGVTECGHPVIELGVVQPSIDATGVLIYRDASDLIKISRSGDGGVILKKRACNGECSNETFSLVRDIQSEDIPVQIKDGMYLEIVRTSYKPYDLAVNICLIIAKHHLKNDIMVSSDGDIEKWSDAMQICEHFLGYGSDFELEK